MENIELFKIAQNFEIDGNPAEISIIESGHINRTYLVKYDTGKKYILQYVNTNVFPNIVELMNNIEKVTEFIRKKGNCKTLKFIKTKTGSYIYNNNWRMQEFIENTKTFISTDSLSILKEAGKAIGDFQNELNGFNAESLYEIIPKFHYTPNRVNQLKSAIENETNKEQRKDRFQKASNCISFLTDKKRIEKTDKITSKLENHTIPLRVTHNDTKLSNILMDKDKNTYVALIDLDTIMPGSVLYDFGEGIRTGVTIAPEDEQDLSKIYVDMERFKAYTEGFLETAGKSITKEEKELLPLGAWMMTYENAIRFLADYLNGDVYFTVHNEDQNLHRATAQAEILRQMEENEEKMKGMINEYGL